MQSCQWVFNMGKLNWSIIPWPTHMVHCNYRSWSILHFGLGSHVGNIWIGSWANFPKYMDLALQGKGWDIMQNGLFVQLRHCSTWNLASSIKVAVITFTSGLAETDFDNSLWKFFLECTNYCTLPALCCMLSLEEHIAWKLLINRLQWLSLRLYINILLLVVSK